WAVDDRPLRVGAGDEEQAIGIPERQRPQQGRVDDAEHGSGRADADADDRDRDDRELARLEQRPDYLPHLSRSPCNGPPPVRSLVSIELRRPSLAINHGSDVALPLADDAF